MSDWKTVPTHTIAGISELYEQLLPTKLYNNNFKICLNILIDFLSFFYMILL